MRGRPAGGAGHPGSGAGHLRRDPGVGGAILLGRCAEGCGEGIPPAGHGEHFRTEWGADIPGARPEAIRHPGRCGHPCQGGAGLLGGCGGVPLGPFPPWRIHRGAGAGDPPRGGPPGQPFPQGPRGGSGRTSGRRGL